MRTFISLNLSEQIKRNISEIQNDLKEKVSELNKKFLDSIKWESADKFHITLFFIGEVNEAKLKEIDICLSRIENELSIGEINFTAKEINAFPKLKYPRVIIINLNNEDEKVFVLSEKVNLALKEIGFEPDKKFHPHITVGRVRREHKINLSELKDKVDFDFKFSVKNFYLMKSELKKTGSEYSIIREYGL